jgi:hypothetical protein
MEQGCKCGHGWGKNEGVGSLVVQLNETFVVHQIVITVVWRIARAAGLGSD